MHQGWIERSTAQLWKCMKNVSMDVQSLHARLWSKAWMSLKHLPCMFQCGGVGTFPGHLSSQRKELHSSEQESVVSHAELGSSFIDDQLGRKNTMREGLMDTFKLAFKQGESWVYLMVCELLAFSPLGVKATINEAVFPDLLLLVCILRAHSEDVTHSFCYFLVHPQQSLYLCGVWPGQGPIESLHALHHGPGRLLVQLPSWPGWQGCRDEGRGGHWRCGRTRRPCGQERWAVWFLLGSRCRGKSAIPIRVWAEPVRVHGGEFFPVVCIRRLGRRLGAGTSRTAAVHRGKTCPVLCLTGGTRLPVAQSLSVPASWPAGARPFNFEQRDPPKRDISDGLAEKGRVRRPVAESLLQPTHMQRLGGHANQGHDFQELLLGSLAELLHVVTALLDEGFIVGQQVCPLQHPIELQLPKGAWQRHGTQHWKVQTTEGNRMNLQREQYWRC